MSDTLEKEKEMNYPKRGCMSEDGKFYTHWDGSVHEVHRERRDPCYKCSLCVNGVCLGKGINGCHWSGIEGAYVPSDEEAEACDMAREAIKKCVAHYAWSSGCKSCAWFIGKTCDTRKYLAAHHQPDAWEIKP